MLTNKILSLFNKNSETDRFSIWKPFFLSVSFSEFMCFSLKSFHQSCIYIHLSGKGNETPRNKCELLVYQGILNIFEPRLIYPR